VAADLGEDAEPLVRCELRDRPRWPPGQQRRGGAGCLEQHLCVLHALRRLRLPGATDLDDGVERQAAQRVGAAVKI
jgi:hypothetical protein